MDRESVLAKCHLHAVLPLLEELVKYDDQAKKIIADWKGTVQFSCPGGFGEYIEFSDGKAKAFRGTTQWPTVALWFFSPRELNKLFTGRGFTLPIPWKGLTRPGMLKGFTELTKRLEYYMQTPQGELPKEHKAFVVKMKLYTAVRAIKEVGENDPHVIPYAQKMANGVAELRIAGGPAAHIKIQNGIISPVIGSAKKVNALMEFAGVDIAGDVFDDKIDAMAAIGAGDIKLEGMIPLVDNMNAILDRVSTYLS